MAAAAAAAAKYSGKFAVHPLLPGAAQVAVNACTGRLKPSWVPRAQAIFGKFEKLHMCMPRYAEFLTKTSHKDLKRPHIFMNDEAQSKLGEFYLCCAFRLRPDAVESAGQDNQKLLELAHTVATEDVEPLFEECRDFVSTYDKFLHEDLNGTTIWRDVDDGLFWHHSFEVAAPKAYAAFREMVLPSEGEWPDREDTDGLEAVLGRCEAAVAEGGPARPFAEDVYQTFLEASSMPVKATLREVLVEHKLLLEPAAKM